jgi:hypothetical protein
MPRDARDAGGIDQRLVALNVDHRVAAPARRRPGDAIGARSAVDVGVISDSPPKRFTTRAMRSSSVSTTTRARPLGGGGATPDVLDHRPAGELDQRLGRSRVEP